MSRAFLKCQHIIAACGPASQAASSALASPYSGAAADLDQVRREVRAIQGLLALAMAAEREGQLTMQVSAEDFLLLADFYEG
ncbi:hypothetical protein MHZ93_05085 [Roseomonas sp. ACRSG]|nr:hypothetical protein [Roseomonas sp. ACRSG]